MRSCISRVLRFMYLKIHQEHLLICHQSILSNRQSATYTHTQFRYFCTIIMLICLHNTIFRYTVGSVIWRDVILQNWVKRSSDWVNYHTVKSDFGNLLNWPLKCVANFILREPCSIHPLGHYAFYQESTEHVCKFEWHVSVSYGLGVITRSWKVS